MRLPSRDSSKALLAKLDQSDRERFTADLLDAVWDAYEALTLPSKIAVVVRDWLAHAHFENDPVTQERLTEVRRPKAGSQ